jgi:putative ABC transport system permease protein
MRRLFQFPWRTPRSIARDVDDELQFHLEARTERLMASGLTRGEAETLARREFGDLEDARTYLNAVDLQAESYRRRREWFGEFRRDVAYAIRTLRRAPAFAATAILTLAVGIGANTAVLNLVNAVLLRPPAVQDPDGLAWIQPSDARGRLAQWSFPDYVTYAGAAAAWSDVSAMGNVDLALGGQQARRLSGQAVSASYFRVLGVTPMLGRGFLAYEDSTSTEALAVLLSHRTWRAWFDADSAIVGRTISLNQRAVTVVGVAPEEFTGLRLGEECDFWVPFAALPVLDQRFATLYTHRGSTWVRGIGRLAAGATLEGAASEAVTLASRVEPAGIEPRDRRSIAVNRMRGSVDPVARGRMIPLLSLLMVVPLLVLGVACANVASLYVSRGLQRQKELAVRRALGASRGRLVRQLLTECLILGVAAGIVGVALSYVLTASITAAGQLPDDVVRILVPDLRVFAMTLALAILAGIVFGLLPVLAATRETIMPSLKSDGLARPAGRGRFRLQHAFVVSQVALSLTLLITAGLFVGSFRKALRVDPGFDATNLVAMVYDLRGLGYDSARVARFGPTVVERVAATAGVEDAALTHLLPLSGGANSTRVRRAEGPDDDEGLVSIYTSISEDFFKTMRMPLVRGRPFTGADGPSSPLVAIVNEEIAERFWPGVDPIGKRIRFGGNVEEWEVVGVAPNGRYKSLAETEPQSAFWLPMSQRPSGTMATVVVRGTTGTEAAVAALRGALQAADPGLPPFTIEPVESAIARTVEGQRSGAALLAVFGAIGLVLATFGVFGVVAQGVAARTKEIGIRMSLGAHASEVVAAFVREGLSLTAIGAFIGIGMSLAASRLLANLIFGLSPTDLLTFAGATLVLLLVAGLASYVPARRAAEVDPVEALRAD